LIMPRIHRFDSVDSTMIRAAALADSGCESGTVVVADEQTSGQGRHGHSWYSEKNAGLYMSQVLRVKMCPDSLPIVTLAFGLATADAIAQVAGVACDLRWPNDVLVGTKKCAGVLVQLHEGVLILGIGVNVNHSSFPPEIAGLATSLKLATGKEWSREQLLLSLVEAVNDNLETLLQFGTEAVLRAFTQSSSYVDGRRVVVDIGGQIIEGVTQGLDAQGFLKLRGDNGRNTLILAGGVRAAHA
jgi:BirA family transcriptional regulator, biotin operon repressor / biotin---[acetyl-CoA-carboxylase] ligase